MPNKDDGLVTVYAKRPTFIEGVPHVDQQVTAKRATDLTRHMDGAAFTTDPDDPERIHSSRPPSATRRPRPVARRPKRIEPPPATFHLPPPEPIHPPPDEEAERPTGPVEQTGPFDSQEASG